MSDYENDYPYIVRAYYADDVKPPKQPGGLAIEVRLATADMARLEADVARGRDDIGIVNEEGPRRQ